MSETLPLPTPPKEAADTPATPAPEAATPPATPPADEPAREPALQADPPPAASPDAAAAEATVPVAPQMSLAECAQQLKQRFPALFGGAVKPMKLRIQVDIQARAPGVFSKQVLSAFFRRHTGSTSYLLAVVNAAHRFDLDGAPAGDITAEHRQVAQDELTRRRSSQDERRRLEDQQRQLEEQQRRNRAGLLHDFQTTTLTKPNFCALKGVPVDELDGLLEIARAEAAERARQAPPPMRRPPDGFERPRRRDGERPADAGRSNRGGRGRG